MSTLSNHHIADNAIDEPQISQEVILRFTNEEDGTAEYLRAMASYGITSADVVFDGSGDEGQITGITGKGITDELRIMRLRDEHKHLLEEICQENKTVHDLIETFVYEMLDRTGYDWINNDGGYGKVHVEPADGVVKIDMNIRILIAEYCAIDMSNPRVDLEGGNA
jgi:hypothetical protein